VRVVPGRDRAPHVRQAGATHGAPEAAPRAPDLRDRGLPAHDPGRLPLPVGARVPVAVGDARPASRHLRVPLLRGAGRQGTGGEDATHALVGPARAGGSGVHGAGPYLGDQRSLVLRYERLPGLTWQADAPST